MRGRLLTRLAILHVIVVACGVTVFAADDPQVASLAKEVCGKGWIVYSARSSTGDWDLFVMRPDGSAARNITNTKEFNEAGPRFSPDGKKLLYRRLAKDVTINHDRWGFQGQLMIADADGHSATPVGKEKELTWATWSPDGKQIACLLPKGIHIVDLASNKVVREWPRQGMYQQLTWSPDGQWFCGVTSHLNEKWTVARINLETGAINPVNTFQNCTPDWFADSKRIIFSHRPANQKANKGYGWTQLWMADGDGNGKNRRLVYGQDGQHIYGGALSPDDRYVLFTKSVEDGGGSEKDGAPMFLMRLADTPSISGESNELRKLHPDTKDGPELSLPIGWEPHWTYAEVGGKK